MIEEGETLHFCTENSPEVVARQMVFDQVMIADFKADAKHSQEEANKLARENDQLRLDLKDRQSNIDSLWDTLRDEEKLKLKAEERVANLVLALTYLRNFTSVNSEQIRYIDEVLEGT